MSTRIEQLRTEFRALCRKLGVRRVLHAVAQHDGSPHVEIRGDAYHYVVTERGSEITRKTTTEKQELLYWLVSDVVFELAIAFELEHRVKGRSFRRLLFAKEIEFIGKANADWAKKKAADIQKILLAHPYDDEAEG